MGLSLFIPESLVISHHLEGCLWTALTYRPPPPQVPVDSPALSSPGDPQAPSTSGFPAPTSGSSTKFILSSPSPELGSRDGVVDGAAGEWGSLRYPPSFSLPTSLQIAIQLMSTVQAWLPETCRECPSAEDRSIPTRQRGRRAAVTKRGVAPGDQPGAPS